MTSDIDTGRAQVARDMRHLAKTLRQLATHADALGPVDLTVLDFMVGELQRQVYDVADRLDVMESQAAYQAGRAS